jgi:hypothetical protein
LRRLVALVFGVGALLVLSACSGKTTGATNVTDASGTLTASASCDRGETCTWYWEYWPASAPRSAGVKTPVHGPVSGPVGPVNLSVKVKGVSPNTTYRWVLCGSPNDGQSYGCVGPNGTVGSTTADPPPDYATFTTLPQRTLAEAWNGASWATRKTPNPTGATYNTLLGVSCTSATACTAVGYYDSGGAQMTLAERWDGTSWTIQPTPNPTGGTFNSLSGVSCTSATACTAAGSYLNSAESYVTLVERWDGTGWTIQPSPNPGGVQGSVLSAVSCTSATACIAVGNAHIEMLSGETLAESWDGTSWTIQPTPNPTGATNSNMSGVSCTSATACTAAGSYFILSDQPAGGTLAERWDGTSWTIQPTPNPSGGSLSGVSCTSATACTAVGSSTASDSSQPLAEGWDGTAWTIQTTPTVPHSAGGSKLSNGACTSATACEAVGQRTVANGSTHTLAEGWNGTTWSVQTTPPPLGKFATLNGVSCTSGTHCTAVGKR